MNRYYEKNERPSRHPVCNRDVTTYEVTTHYYLGGKEIALRKGSTVSYLSQDHLTGTSVISADSPAAKHAWRQRANRS